MFWKVEKNCDSYTIFCLQKKNVFGSDQDIYLVSIKMNKSLLQLNALLEKKKLLLFCKL